MVTFFSFLTLFFCWSAVGQLPARAEEPDEQIKATVAREYGDKVRIVADTDPYYFVGDFNGDGFADLAVLVNVEEGRAEIKSRGVKYVGIDPYSRDNGRERDPVSAMGQHCLGLAVLHGGAAGWGAPAGKYLFYECFSGMKLITKKRRVWRGSGSRGRAPVLRGDAITIDLESGAMTLIYWDGRTYRGYGLRGGD